MEEGSVVNQFNNHKMNVTMLNIKENIKVSVISSMNLLLKIRLKRELCVKSEHKSNFGEQRLQITKLEQAKKLKGLLSAVNLKGEQELEL